jgi:hypothetical protein
VDGEWPDREAAYDLEYDEDTPEEIEEIMKRPPDAITKRPDEHD